MGAPIRRVQPTMPPIGMGKPKSPKAEQPEAKPAEQPEAKPAEQPEAKPAEQPEQVTETTGNLPREADPGTSYDGSPFATIGREIGLQSIRYHAHALGQVLGLDSDTIRGVLAQVLSEYGEPE